MIWSLVTGGWLLVTGIWFLVTGGWYNRQKVQGSRQIKNFYNRITNPLYCISYLQSSAIYMIGILP
jgi:hypothetical protein